MLILKYFIFILIIHGALISGWTQWNYSTQWTDDNTFFQTQTAWEKIWSNSGSAPRPRRGHSLVMMEYEGSSYLVLFGGRDNDQNATHIPTTYNVIKANDTTVFTTYDGKPINPCNDINGTYYTIEQRSHCDNTTTTTASSSMIEIGKFYNDVWAYRLCHHHDQFNTNTTTTSNSSNSSNSGNNTSSSSGNNTGSSSSTRYYDGPCEGSGWIVWHTGAREGGCVITLGVMECSAPSERYEHGAVAFADGLMYIYGGYSQRCGDYCDDMWAFDIGLKTWKIVYSTGALSKLYSEVTSSGEVLYTSNQVPKDDSSQQWAGPGKRWKHSMVISDVYNSTTTTNSNNNNQVISYQRIAIFGGHRLWQGFSQQNDANNNWINYDTLPSGGYLNDLWIYTRPLDYTSISGIDFRATNGTWEKLSIPDSTCNNDYTETCILPNTPSGRAGHASVYDDARQLIWIHGGYHTYFPYLTTDGIGSGSGVTSLKTGGFVPYPGYPFFLNDLWYYNLTDHTWTLVNEVTDVKPSTRAGHVLLYLGPILFLHGGYSDNNYYEDLWYYNISANRWLQKTTFRHPIYPESCTDDEEYIKNHSSTCIQLLWPKHLQRDSHYPYDILPYEEQHYYWPDPDIGRTYSTLNTDGTLSPLSYGSPIFPYQATGSLQYAQQFIYAYNSTYNSTIITSCTSVFGEPTRGQVLDGKYGRASQSIFIPQPRRQRPGWDGCRDRADNRIDLEQGILQYIHPYARAGHKAVYHPPTNEIFMYGGIGYTDEQPITYSNTWPKCVNDELWYFNIHYCLNNCSFHGDCHYGFCRCNAGFYGIDCSNQTCPGSSCFYDDFTSEQTCYHACQAGYIHTDNDTYVQDISKIPCSRENSGISHGICDGFGNVQCTPPFIGSDCSIKDCPYNCSFNGYCSVEYPVSRCMCQPGYYGNHCQYKVCLNNCSYPNGLCNATSGLCTCNMMFNPYNKTQPFHPWEGEDCSYIWAYSSASTYHKSYHVILITMICIISLTLFLLFLS